jgi:hypothetical protein
VLPIKIPITFCTEVEKSILNHKRPQIAKAILCKKYNAEGITIPVFKLYCRAITIKTARYWVKNRQKNQWIRMKDPDINTSIYSQLIFDKRHNGEKTASSTNIVFINHEKHFLFCHILFRHLLR